VRVTKKSPPRVMTSEKAAHRCGYCDLVNECTSAARCETLPVSSSTDESLPSASPAVQFVVMYLKEP